MNMAALSGKEWVEIIAGVLALLLILYYIIWKFNLFIYARKHLIAALPGDSAFKRGRVKPDEQPADKAEPLTEAGPDNPAGQPDWTRQGRARRARAMDGPSQTRPPAFSGDETGGTQGGAS